MLKRSVSFAMGLLLIGVSLLCGLSVVLAEDLDGVSPYFPADRIPLPPSSRIIGITNDFESVEDDASCWETTALELTMTKSEAIEYFSPLLNRGEVNQFVVSKDMSDFIPWEVLYDYPEVGNYVELYAWYNDLLDSARISIIKVLLFTTAEDQETIVLAWIQVNYASKPTTNPSDDPDLEEPATDLKTESFKQAALDAGCRVFDDWTYGVFTAFSPASGFDMQYEDAFVSVLEFYTAGEARDFMGEQQAHGYEFYCDGRFVALTMEGTFADAPAAYKWLGELFTGAQ